MKPVILTCFVVALALWCCGCTVVPTSDGRYAMVAGTKADAVAIADPHNGHVIFEAINLDQTDGLRFARDSFIADRLFRFLRAESANTASVDKAGIEGQTSRHAETEATRRATEREITRRAMIE